MQNEFGAVLQDLANCAWIAQQRYRDQRAGLRLWEGFQQLAGGPGFVKVDNQAVKALFPEPLQRDFAVAETLHRHAEARQNAAENFSGFVILRYQQCLKGHTAFTLRKKRVPPLRPTRGYRTA